jgi:hypothetical protein
MVPTLRRCVEPTLRRFMVLLSTFRRMVLLVVLGD